MRVLTARHLFVVVATSLLSNSSQAFSVVPSTASSVVGNLQMSEESSQEEAVVVDTYVRCGKCQTIYPVTERDLGTRGKGRRLECSVCSHSWFQSKERLLSLREGFDMTPLPQADLDRIATNIQEGREPKHMGDSKLYVGNIAFACHEDDIFQVFSQAGSVGEVNLVRDETGRNRGFGFVTMRTKEEGQKAIEDLDGTPIRGRKLTVRESNN